MVSQRIIFGLVRDTTHHARSNTRRCRYGSYTHMAGGAPPERRWWLGGSGEKSVVFAEIRNFSKCRPPQTYRNILFLPTKIHHHGSQTLSSEGTQSASGNTFTRLRKEVFHLFFCFCQNEIAFLIEWCFIPIFSPLQTHTLLRVETRLAKNVTHFCELCLEGWRRVKEGLCRREEVISL